MTTTEAARGRDPNAITRCVVCDETFTRHPPAAEPDRWRCDECINTGRRLRWPLTGVDSSDFASAPYVQRLHEMAVAFLESAKVLVEALGGSEAITWPRASVVYSTSNHAVELFLKACIIKASPGDNVGHHNVQRLLQRLVELHPTINPFDPVWDSRMSGIPTDQLFRYGADKTGATLEDGDELIFAPAKWIQWLEHVDSEFHRMWSAIT